MATHPTSVQAGPYAATLRWVRLGQHALIAVLLIIGLARAVDAGANPALLALAAAATVAWYVLGDRVLRRCGISSHLGGWWLVGLAVCWLGLVVLSAENVWLGFGLWLLAGHVMPLRWALAFSLAVLAVVITPVALGEHASFAAIVGPAVGGACALVLSIGQDRLAREGAARQRLVDDLVRAQAETEVLHADLARTQREAGVAAERARLARDIHDTLAQGFSSIVLLSRAGARADDVPELHRLLGLIEQSAAENLQETRRVVAALAPPQLREGGIAAALRSVIERITEGTGLECTLDVDPDLPPLGGAREIAILRITQGLLANVTHHASASTCTITLGASPDQVRLDVVDDGKGFDTDGWQTRGPSASGGYGLRATRERAQGLGGDVAVESTPGEGTAVSVWLPLRLDNVDLTGKDAP